MVNFDGNGNWFWSTTKWRKLVKFQEPTNLNFPPSDTVASISTSSLNLLPTFFGSILTSASNLQAEINSETEQKEEKLSNPADEKVFFF